MERSVIKALSLILGVVTLFCSRLSYLTKLSLKHNKLSGPLPASLLNAVNRR
jgi:hypothetical protein